MTGHRGLECRMRVVVSRATAGVDLREQADFLL